MGKGQEDVYRNHLSIVEMYMATCNDFLADVEATSKLFSELEKDYGFVDGRTGSIQAACENLLEEQHRLTRLADGLASRLEYFNRLEPIAKLFNSPGDDICLNPEFIPMLEQLDKCLDYMEQHVSLLFSKTSLTSITSHTS